MSLNVALSLTPVPNNKPVILEYAMSLSKSVRQCRFFRQCLFFVVVPGALLSAAAHVAQADVVTATYVISASDFRNGASGPPPSPPTSNNVSGTYTITFNSAIIQQFEMVPDVVIGLDITDNDGVVFDYDTSNSGFNTFWQHQEGIGHITIGATISGVAFMAGISNDFRVQFDVSADNFAVTEVTENLSFVTTRDAFYSANNTSVELIAVSILPDGDLDNVLDSNDNCQIVANSDQRDTDSDGIGNACDPDFNQDCNINFADLAVMRANFFASGDLVTDLNGDLATNAVDLGIMKSRFFQTPGPSGLPNACSL